VAYRSAPELLLLLLVRVLLFRFLVFPLFDFALFLLFFFSGSSFLFLAAFGECSRLCLAAFFSLAG
jgi:hypothetical protein